MRDFLGARKEALILKKLGKNPINEWTYRFRQWLTNRKVPLREKKQQNEEKEDYLQLKKRKKRILSHDNRTRRRNGRRSSFRKNHWDLGIGSAGRRRGWKREAGRGREKAE